MLMTFLQKDPKQVQVVVKASATDPAGSTPL